MAVQIAQAESDLKRQTYYAIEGDASRSSELPNRISNFKKDKAINVVCYERDRRSQSPLVTERCKAAIALTTWAKTLELP